MCACVCDTDSTMRKENPKEKTAKEKTRRVKRRRSKGEGKHSCVLEKINFGIGLFALVYYLFVVSWVLHTRILHVSELISLPYGYFANSCFSAAKKFVRASFWGGPLSL